MARLADEEQAIIADLGGASELTQLERDMIRSYRRLAHVEEFDAIQMDEEGVHTTTGKRRAVINSMRQTIAQKTDLAKTLGLKRRARNVPQTVGDIVASVKGA